MSRSIATASSILRAALLVTTALGLLNSGAAFARVGVTSATDGDPLGKPPAEAERVLRIGIDVQANEVIRTGANDRAHLVFLDGTALTIGPNATLTIDKFVYDPATKTGEIAINATKGVMRLVGGKISKTNPITITTPSSTIGIRGGICVLDVQQGNTTSTFLFGNNMTVTGGGGTQNVTRPGSQVTTTIGRTPGAPTLVNQGALTGQLGQLEGTTGGSGGQAGQQGGQQQGGNTAANGTGAERGAQTFAQNNTPTSGGQGQPPGGAGLPPNQQNTLNNAITNSTQSQQVDNTPVRTTKTTQVIVSRNSLGRYLGDPTYTQPNAATFKPGNLGVDTQAANDKLISSPSNVTTTTTTNTTTIGGKSTSTSSSSSTITLAIPAGTSPSGTVDLPWQPGTLASGFDIPGTMQAFGLTLTGGKGYVSPNGEFFAYLFKSNGNTVGLFGGTPTVAGGGTTNFPTTGVAAYTMGSIGNGSALPFANGDGVGSNADIKGAAVVGKLYAAYSTALQQTSGSVDARATALQAAISIAGTGSSQKSYMGVFIGTFFRDINGTTTAPTNDNGVALSGSYNGTYRLSSTGNINQTTSAASTPLVNGANAIYGTAGSDGAASAIVLTPDRLTSVATISGGTSTIATTRNTQAAYDSGATRTDYYAVNVATLTATPAGVGTTRTTQTLNGFVGGVVEQTDSSNAVTNRTITTSAPSALTVNTDATNNRASINFTVSNWSGSNSAEFKLGGTTGGNNASSAFIDNNIYAVRDRTTDVGNTTSVGSSTTGVTSATTMVSYNAAPVSGMALCSECTFLTYGWWGGDVTYGTGAAVNVGGRDRINLATYVAGTLSDPVAITNMNNPGTTATYKGNMVGNVVSGSSSYIASGTYQNIWNFGSRAGTVGATFDGTTYGSTTAGNFNTTNPVGTNTFSTNGAGNLTTGNNTLSLNGAFFSNGTANPVAGQAGSFAVTGTGTGAASYQAGGTFAAKKQ
jgi:hypothetical protein